LSLDQRHCQCRLADNVDGYGSLRKQSIIMLGNEASVNVAGLELWMPGQVIKELYVGV